MPNLESGRLISGPRAEPHAHAGIVGFILADVVQSVGAAVLIVCTPAIGVFVGRGSRAESERYGAGGVSGVGSGPPHTGA